MQLVLLLFVILLIKYSLANNINYCLGNEKDAHLHFASKTPYRFISDWKIEKRTIPNCKPVQIWMLARHGTRYPQKSAIERLTELPDIRDQIIYSHEKEGKGHLCDEDLEKLKNWSPNRHLTSSYASKLALEGWREGRELGRRLKHEYPELLQVPIHEINENNFIFRSIKGSRSVSSMIALMEGLFDDDSAVKPAITPKNDTLLRGDRHCERWSHEKRGADVERDGFIRGFEYVSLQRNVSQRLGFNVTPETIHNMQDMCRFETAWTPNDASPWCGIFNNEEWKIMEYIDDLQYYYSSGYGLDINRLIGCFPAEDLFNHFSAIEDGDSENNPRGIFYFSTSRILMDFLHFMTFAKDSEKLSAKNFRNMTDRKWRVTFISPFFSNFVAVFHRCNHSAGVNKVTFYLNEKLIQYKGCPDSICDWEYVKNDMRKNAHHCNRNCFNIVPDVERILSTDYLDYIMLAISLLVVGLLCRNAIVNVAHRGLRYVVQKRAFKKIFRKTISL